MVCNIECIVNVNCIMDSFNIFIMNVECIVDGLQYIVECILNWNLDVDRI